ncbi:hypothetical protein [Paracoccus benzoatiresistens]|uniref:UmuC domain-containing protein n=1 Tax=Paracoccus benzoatiresistens TaxID=2997341 RepID=A0ABT4J9D7_9RHOB|nr:hypothetical protein [Paracoccus sp. EF6]MCZ0963519.1 hypothetical protein [Paracoccus sp. EF6]
MRQKRTGDGFVDGLRRAVQELLDLHPLGHCRAVSLGSAALRLLEDVRGKNGVGCVGDARVACTLSMLPVPPIRNGMVFSCGSLIPMV